jgi:hypothetical protein
MDIHFSAFIWVRTAAASSGFDISSCGGACNATHRGLNRTALTSQKGSVSPNIVSDGLFGQGTWAPGVGTGITDPACVASR